MNEINYDKEISKLANNIVKKAQEKITKHLTSTQKKLSRSEAENICTHFAKFAETLQAEVQVKLEYLIENNVQKSASDLLEQYKKKLSDLVDEINVGDVALDPFEIMKGEIPTNTTSMITGAAKTEKVKTGEEWVQNTSKKWYKPWTWFQESGHYRSIYEDREYIDGEELSHKFFAPIEEKLFENSTAAQKYAKKETNRIKTEFGKKFDELDKLLSAKLDELKECATNEKLAQKKIEEAEKRLAWLSSIRERVNSILEI